MDDTIFNNIDQGLITKFREYHGRNPEVYERFLELAKVMKTKRSRYSAWTIINMIRWESDLRLDQTFKINNDFISLYARLTIQDHPEFVNFFELRTMKSSDRRDSAEERYRTKAY